MFLRSIFLLFGSNFVSEEVIGMGGPISVKK